MGIHTAWVQILNNSRKKKCDKLSLFQLVTILASIWRVKLGSSLLFLTLWLDGYACQICVEMPAESWVTAESFAEWQRVCRFSLFYFRKFFFKEKFQGQIWISLEAWKQDQCQRNVIRKLMNRVMAILIQDLEESCFHYLKKLIIYSLKNERITQSK